MLGAIKGMKMNKPFKHNNNVFHDCYVSILSLNQPLFLFEFASKDGIEQNLGRITKGDVATLALGL
jgi:hypothetical protein